MKRSIEVILMAAVIGLLSITAATAEGIQEQRENVGDDLVTVTGTVEFTASGAELKASDGQEYELMYPRFAAEEINVESGDTISVEGYIVPGPRWEEDDDEQHLMISKVTIDEEEYDLSRQFGPGSRGGVFGGRMCCDDGEYGYGPRGGYGMPGRPGGPDQFGGPGPYDRNEYDRGPGMQGSRPYRW
ncbi:MAG: hypothetical protein SVR04_09150 [Spirochaetota bacterium]|nr:hypothetical protein [Spirochaetota bacterium]